MNLLDLLVAGNVDEFNAQRGQRRRVELFAVELAGAALMGVDLSGAHLEKSDLTGADLTDANLTKADLTGIDAGEAKFCDVIGIGCKLREAFLDSADLSGADLSHADLNEAVLTGTAGAHLRLTNARLREVDATDASWSTADLSEAKLHKANFTKADLSGCDLTEASAGEAIFTDANLEGCIALRARFQQANLQRARLVGARLEEANLQGADLSGANLERADLRRANLSGAVLTGANLRGASLADAVLEGVDLAGLDMADVDLTGIDPRVLGLSEEQLENVAAVGASASEDAPLRFSDVSIAKRGGLAAILWENADDEEALSLRYALVEAGAPPRLGILPVSAEGVLARAVVPSADGFALVVLQERPGGVALVRYSLGPKGELGTAEVDPLGYDPGVRPVVRVHDGAIWLWGLARRGPTLVIQKIDGEGVHNVHSERLATARGFLGGHHPLLACKGGVLIPVGPTGAGSPLRTPNGFPGRIAVAVPQADDKILVVWTEESRGDDDPGGLRYAILGPGLTPDARVLTVGGEVTSLDAIEADGGAWIVWNEIGGPAGDAAFLMRWPDGEPGRLAVQGNEVYDEIRFADAVAGDEPPVLSLGRLDEGLLVADARGEELAEFIPEE